MNSSDLFVPFDGEYKGWPVSEVPTSYLEQSIHLVRPRNPTEAAVLSTMKAEMNKRSDDDSIRIMKLANERLGKG